MEASLEVSSVVAWVSAVPTVCQPRFWGSAPMCSLTALMIPRPATSRGSSWICQTFSPYLSGAGTLPPTNGLRRTTGI
jgi:hypothetical protein